MNIRLPYVLIPAFWLTILWLGKVFTSAGMVWYRTLVQAPFTPPPWAFAVAWNMIFACAILATLIVWNFMPRNRAFWITISLIVLNGITNVLWTYLFFYKQMTGYALIDATALTCSTWALVFLLWSKNEEHAALLFVPYALWLILALYLNSIFFILN